MPNPSRSEYERLYKHPGISVRAPGRINLIGEHTDYNLGFVLPAAINRYIYATIGYSGSEKSSIYAADLDETVSFSMNAVQKTRTWADYIIGGLTGLKNKHDIREGFNMVICGDIPQGAGLSSSAALECAGLLAMVSLYNLSYDQLELVRIALDAERNFVGLDCGIMDQYASMFGKADQVLLIDCMNETHRYIPLEIGDYSILLVDSRVTHSLAGSAYNERRRQCEEGVRHVQTIYPHVRSLREVSLDMLEKVSDTMPEIIMKRCSYIVRENDRVLTMTDMLLDDDFDSAGELLFEAHRDMRDNYEITCEQTDFLVDFAHNCGLVAGARQMGGGFGGCVLNLLEKENISTYKDQVKSAYLERFGKEPEFIEVETSDAGGLIEEYR